MYYHSRTTFPFTANLLAYVGRSIPSVARLLLHCTVFLHCWEVLDAKFFPHWVGLPIWCECCVSWIDPHIILVTSFYFVLQHQIAGLIPWKVPMLTTCAWTEPFTPLLVIQLEISREMKTRSWCLYKFSWQQQEMQQQSVPIMMVKHTGRRVVTALSSIDHCFLARIQILLSLKYQFIKILLAGWSQHVCQLSSCISLWIPQ